jgi:pimeloyl-ACP methyl ester carboxylesterase
MHFIQGAAVSLSIALTVSWTSLASAQDMGEHMVQSSTDEAIEIYVRERLPEGMAPDGVSEAVLFVHGATYPGSTFDVDLADGKSWMDHTVEAGYASYYMDQRGYGRSTRPDVLQQPADQNEPFARAETVIHDIGDVVDFIQERTGLETINLVGWSWGTVTTGMYTSRNNKDVDRLVLFAPVYSYNNENWTSNLADPENPEQLADVGAYRTVTREQADQRWTAQIPADNPEAWRDPQVFDAWYSEMLAMEPDENAEFIKAPNGVLVDIWEIFNSRPVYDASQITVPTLVIRGDDDPTSTDADSQGLYKALASETKRYVVIGDGTHFVNLEKSAPQLYAETLLFLAGAGEALDQLK